MKVLCTLPNASTEISGVKFTAEGNGMASEDVSADVAAMFLSIPGYAVVGENPAAAPAVEEVAPKVKGRPFQPKG